MLEDDRNAADEFTTMSSVIKSTLKWGEGGLWQYMLMIFNRSFSVREAHVSQRLLSKIVDGESKALFSAALKVRNLFLRLSGLFGTGLCNFFFPNSLLTERCECL